MKAVVYFNFVDNDLCWEMCINGRVGRRQPHVTYINVFSDAKIILGCKQVKMYKKNKRLLFLLLYIDSTI